MNKTVEIVNEWAAFEESHPNASIDDFCRHRLTSRKSKTEQVLFEGLGMPTSSNVVLVKLIGRISKLSQLYANIALVNIDLKQIDDFVFLNAIKALKTPRKTEVVYVNFYELSTGLLILDRLRSHGYIIETADEEDKRSKRVQITAVGEQVLQQSMDMLTKVTEIIFQDMSQDDVKLCVQLLKEVDIKFSNLFPKHKGKSFDEIYKDVKSMNQ